MAARVLAVASGGGHWTQLCRLLPAFDGSEVVFATVSSAYAEDVPGHRLVVLTDATRWDRLKLVRLTFEVLWLLLRVRPRVVVSTGAAPGYLAIALARLVRARTLWIDSIANVEELSASGRMALRRADLVLTQWPELARPGGPEYRGSVL